MTDTLETLAPVIETKIEEATPVEEKTPEVIAAEKEAADKQAKEADKQRRKEESRARLFAEKARKDRELQIFQRENNELKNRLTNLEKEREAIKTNPINFIKQQTGMDYEQLTQFYLKQLETEEQQPKTAARDERVERLEEKLALLEQEKQMQLAQAQNQQVNSIINNHLSEVYQYCQKNSDQYEAIISHPDVAQKIYIDIYRQAYSLGGRDLDRDEIVAALNRTEQVLTEELGKQFEKLSKLKKLAPKPKDPEKKPEEPKVTPATNRFAKKTISNDMVTGPADNSNSPVKRKNLSADELHRKKLAEIAAKFDR